MARPALDVLCGHLGSADTQHLAWCDWEELAAYGKAARHALGHGSMWICCLVMQGMQ